MKITYQDNKYRAMIKNDFSENSLELEAIKKVVELGEYKSFNGLEEEFGSEGSFGRNVTEEVILPFNLKNSLKKLNPDLPNEAIDSAFYKMSEGKSNLNMARGNAFFYSLLKDGVLVLFKDENGIEQEARVKIIDWNDTKNNEFLVVKQFKVSGEIYNRRPDLIIFLNGLPLVLIELKASHKNLINGFRDNITDYKNSIPQLFSYNALIVVSNGSESRIGSITSSWEHFSEWKKINDEGEKGIISLDTVIKGVFAPSKLLDIIENFILFMENKNGLTKIIARNHQYLGVNSTIESVKHRKKLAGRLGVFWHTQGSGKSFSMVFLTQKILRKLQGNWTFLIITDREDLDSQIYKNFADCGAVTETEVRARSRVGLKKLLSEDHRNIFAMIQKFSTENKGESFGKISDREDIIVITDEAHRSQYNVLAMNMRKALPNASFLAFTGTPLIKNDEKTKDVFGDYVSIYNFKQSVEDKATVKLYYENRIPELQIINDNLDDDVDAIIKEADLTEEQEERFSKTYVKTYELITRNDRLDKIAKDVVEHFMNRGFMGKAMYIAIDKATAVKMYDKVQEQWGNYMLLLEEQLIDSSCEHKEIIQGKLVYMQKTDMAVIVSSAQNEIEAIKSKGADITKHRVRMNKEDLDVKFKNSEDELRIVFVCAMWITGFDAPSVSTLYLDKILKDHSLMQTMARANRVWKDKPDGIIVDYIGIFGALQKALAIYGDSEMEGGEEDKAIEEKEKLVKILVDSSSDMAVFLQEKNIYIDEIIAEKEHFKQIRLVDQAVEKIVENEKSKESFFNLVGKLKVLLKAILPDVRAEKYLKKILIISIIAQKIIEISAALTAEQREEERQKIKELSQKVAALLDESISIDDYQIKDSKPLNLSEIDFDELKERFACGEKPQTTLESLKSTIKNKIKELMELNPTRESYLDRFEELIKNYNAGDINAEKFFLELVNLSRNLAEEENRHMRENLSQEELVIFDILTKPEPKLSKQEIEEVKAVAKELLEKLKREKLVVDWKKRQSTIAKVKNTIGDVCDKLPEAYDTGVFQNKCDNLYVYFYDNYSSSAHRFRG